MYFEIHDTDIMARAKAPAIGRLLQAWTDISVRDGAVSYQPFDPATLGPLSQHLMVLVAIEDSDFVYVHYGEAIIAASGLDMTGRQTSESKTEVGTFLRDVLAQCQASQKPIFTVHRATDATNVHLWERLILPCQEVDGTDVLIVFSAVRELHEDLLATVLDASPDGIMAIRYVRDEDGRAHDGAIVAANLCAGRIAGRPVEELINSHILDVLPVIIESGLWDRFEQVTRSRQPDRIEIDLMVEGEPAYFGLVITPLGDGVVITFSDLTDRKIAEQAGQLAQLELAAANHALKSEIERRQALEVELTRLATIDALTGVLNRRALTEGLARSMSLSERYGHSLSVIAIDLDRFKSINDTYGHAGGDAALKVTATVLRHGSREDVDLIGRLGGEEFLLVLSHTSLDGAATAAERLRRALGAVEVPHGDTIIRMTGSFGVATWDHTESLDRLMSRADEALYKAKSGGRNLVVLDTGEGGSIALRRFDVPLVQSDTAPPERPMARRSSRPRAKKAVDS